MEYPETDQILATGGVLFVLLLLVALIVSFTLAEKLASDCRLTAMGVYAASDIRAICGGK